MSDFITDYCCTKEQAEQLVALGVRPISLFKYRPDGTVFKLDGWSVWESYEGRTVPCWTIGEMTYFLSVKGHKKGTEAFEQNKETNRELGPRMANVLIWSLQNFGIVNEINAYLQSKLCELPQK